MPPFGMSDKIEKEPSMGFLVCHQTYVIYLIWQSYSTCSLFCVFGCVSISCLFAWIRVHFVIHQWLSRVKLEDILYTKKEEEKNILIIYEVYP